MFRGAQLELFWSYKRWFAGDADIGKIIIANVAMFFPFGFLLTGLLSGTSRKVRATVVTLAAGILSLTIEVLQLFLMRGLFEWDDVISNTAGAVMGLLLYCVLEELLKNNKIFRILTLTAGIAFVIVCAGVLYTGKGDASAEADNASRTVCFQIDEGILRVYRPDYHCWVYQLGGDLYWIVDSDFNFEEDVSTYIQYQMWTTQTRNLPEKRLAHGNLWDNIGGYFEKYELEGDFGAYRVMKRKLPTAYSLTSIITGYYKNGEWIWKNYFRPIYRFGE